MMNRPLAFIQGDLAFPKLSALDGLPPPFGTLRHNVRSMSQLAVQPSGVPAAQQAIRDAVKRKTPSVRARGSNFIFLYTLPPRPDFSDRFAAQLVEAKRFLEAGRVRPQSSRADHALGATIFVACSLALAWLLATCSTHEVRQPLVATVAKQVIAEPNLEVRKALPLVEPASTVASSVAPVVAMSAQIEARVQTAEPPRRREPQHIEKTHPYETAATHRAKADRGTAVAHLAGPRIVNARSTLARIERRIVPSDLSAPTARAAVSKQPEWPVRSATARDTAEQTALLKWAAEQERADMPTLASVAVHPGGDWNARMTQRRITDHPDAFQTRRVSN